MPGVAKAGHMFTQASSNTPTWIQAGQGIAIQQYGDEGGRGSGNMIIYFEAPSGGRPAGATQTANASDWWTWSAGDVMQINLPIGGTTYTYTFSYDTSASCTYTVCGVTYSSLGEPNISFNSAGTANDLGTVAALPAHSGERGSGTYAPTDVYFGWSVLALAGEFALGGYRLYTSAGTIDGTGAGPLTQDSVVSAEDALAGGGGGPRPINGAADVIGGLGSTTTYVFDGGTLVTDADVAANFTITSNGGAMEVASGATQTLSGVLSDETGATGSFTKSGDGTLVLTGTNKHTGGTAVTGGTLQIASDANLGDATGGLTLDGGTLEASASMTTARTVTVGAGGGTVTIGAGNTMTMSGVTSGAGALVLSGGGTFALSGTNTHSGGTVVAGATIQVAIDANLGGAAGGLTLDGGTVATSTSMSTGRSVTVGAGGGALNAASGTTLALTGLTTGTGALSATGAGTIDLSCSISVAGGFTQSLGRLNIGATAVVTADTVVGSSATLSGTGSIVGNLINNGTLAVGNSPGTLTVAGDVTYNSTSVRDVDVDGVTYSAAGGAGSYDRLVITGASSVFTADGAVAPIVRGITGPANNTYDPAIGDRFRIIVTENTAGVTGAFASVTQPSAGMTGTRFDVIYGTNFVDLVITADSFETFASGYGIRNMTNFGAALDGIRSAAGTNGSDDLNTLLNGLYGLSSDGLALALLQLSGQIHAFALADVREAGLSGASRVFGQMRSGVTNGTNTWVDVSGFLSERTADGIATGQDNSARSLWVGADLLRQGDLTLGFGVGYSSSNVDAGVHGSSKQDQMSLALYGFGNTGKLRYDGVLTIGRATMQGTRSTVLATGTLVNTFDASATVASAKGRLGYGFDVADDLEAVTWIGGEVNWTKSKGYTEAGSTVTALTIGDQTDRTARVSLGFELNKALDEMNKLTFSAGGIRTLGNHPNAERTASLHGATWTVSESDYGRNTAFASVGLFGQLNENTHYWGQVGVTHNAGGTNKNASFGIDVRW